MEVVHKRALLACRQVFGRSFIFLMFAVSFLMIFGRGQARNEAYAQAKTNLPSLASPGEKGLEQRPFRAGVLQFAPALDHMKPLGLADYGGWIEANGLLIGAPDSQWLGAFRLPSLAAQWWLKAPEEMTVPPKVFGNSVVLGFRDGSLWKVDVLKGDKIWEVKLPTFPARQIQKAGQTLLVVTASQALYALDLQTGKTLWLYDGDSQEGLQLRNTAPPTVHEKRVYLGLASGDVVGLNLETGGKEWSHPPSQADSRFHDVIGELHVVDQSLIVTRYDGHVTAYSLRSLQEEAQLWKEHPLKLQTITANTLRHGLLYVGTHGGEVHAFNPRNGQELWRQQIGASIVSLTPGEAVLYVVASEGLVAALDSQSGKILWSDRLAATIVAPPIYWQQHIYFATGTKVLYGYKLH